MVADDVGLGVGVPLDGVLAIARAWPTTPVGAAGASRSATSTSTKLILVLVPPAASIVSRPSVTWATTVAVSNSSVAVAWNLSIAWTPSTLTLWRLS